MAEDREYRIVIEAPEGSDGAKKPTAPSPNPAGNAEARPSGGKAEKGLSMLSSKISGVAIYGYAKSIAGSMVSFQVGTVELRTGSRALQQEAQFRYNIAQRAFGIAESIALGAMVGGPVGAAVAVVGSVGQLAMTAIEIGQNQQKLDMEQSIESSQRRLWDIRSGVTGDRSSAVSRGL